MKKFMAILTAIPLILCGCSLKNSKTEQFTVSVNINRDDVYGMHCEYLLGRKAIGGRSIVYKDGGVMNRGDELIFSFLSEDFENPGELSEKPFQIEFYVITENGKEHLINGINPNEKFTFSEDHWEWDASFGEKYKFTLTNGGDDGYFLYPIQ